LIDTEAWFIPTRNGRGGTIRIVYQQEPASIGRPYGQPNLEAGHASEA
jgi:hypothetical protein